MGGREVRFRPTRIYSRNLTTGVTRKHTNLELLVYTRGDSSLPSNLYTHFYFRSPIPAADTKKLSFGVSVEKQILEFAKTLPVFALFLSPFCSTLLPAVAA